MSGMKCTGPSGAGRSKALHVLLFQWTFYTSWLCLPLCPKCIKAESSVPCASIVDAYEKCQIHHCVCVIWGLFISQLENWLLFRTVRKSENFVLKCKCKLIWVCRAKIWYLRKNVGGPWLWRLVVLDHAFEVYRLVFIVLIKLRDKQIINNISFYKSIFYIFTLFKSYSLSNHWNNYIYLIVNFINV